jgi:hypothetical protein
MAKLTPEQRAENMRRWHASRTPEEKRQLIEPARRANAAFTYEERHVAAVKGYLTRQKNRGIKPRGRLTARDFNYGEDPLEDL